MPFLSSSVSRIYWFYRKSLLQNDMKDWKFYERVFDNIFLSVLSAFNIHNSVYWLNNETFFREILKSRKLMTHRFYGNKYMFLLITDITNLP